MSQRSKILLLIPHLGGGGAEHVIAQLARGLSRSKYDVHLGLVTQEQSECEPLPGDVTLHRLGAHSVRTGCGPVLRLVHMLEPDVLLSGIAHLNLVVLLLRPFFPQKTRVLARQNGTFTAPFRTLPRSWTSLLYRWLYPRADRILCQTREMARACSEIVGTEAKIRTLPNPVNLDRMRKSDQNRHWSGTGPHLLAVGRLAREKGFDLLIEAFALLRTQYPSCDLAILGSGPEERELKSLCQDRGLEQCVRFPGHVPNPSEWFPGATLFVLSSHHEGLPNALLEAAAAGLPIVATPAAGGLPSLLHGDPGACIASEISLKALAAALRTALSTFRDGERFPHPWIEDFRFEHALQLYEELIDEVLQEGKR